MELTISELEKRRKRKEKELNYWVAEKNIILDATINPKSQNYSNIKIEGGKRSDKYKHLDYSIDEIDPIIEILNKQIKNINKLIEESLIISGEYSPILEKIVKLREDKEFYIKNGKQMPFWMISMKIGLSRETCNKMYNKYKKIRIKEKY